MSTIWAPKSEEPPKDQLAPAQNRIPELLANASEENGKRWSELNVLLDELQKLGFSTPVSEWAINHSVKNGSLLLRLKAIEKQTSSGRNIVSAKKTPHDTVIVEATETLWAMWKNPAQGEETQSAVPQNSAPQADSYDLAIFIALAEEFRVFKQHIDKEKLTLLPTDETGERFYSYEHTTSTKVWKCVVAFAGDMGQSRATRLTERLITRFHPTHIAVLGIAGALSDDLRLCDVVVATSVESYLANAKVESVKHENDGPRGLLSIFRNWMNGTTSESNGGSYTFKLSGETYRASHTIKAIAEHFEFSGIPFDEWSATATAALEEHFSANQLKNHEPQLRTCPKILCGHIACGDVVAAAPAFTKFLLDHDRKFLAVEMESSGVLGSVHERGRVPSTVVIRGISDFADDRKKDMDATGSGAFRTVAMHNAVSLLWKLLDQMNSTSAQHSPDVVRQLPNANRQIDVPHISTCEVSSYSLQTNVIGDVIAALQDYFHFRWEPGSFPNESVTDAIVYWPVRLRHPTPIHALQTFAASALSKRGVRVVLCLDDLGNVDHGIADFQATIERWWKRTDGANNIKVETFTTLIEDAEQSNNNPWPTARKWLGSTNRKLDQVLRLSKIVNETDEGDTILKALSERPPRRLLNPPVVWACMSYVASKHQATNVLTLGGHDERALWETWRSEIAGDTLHVGHLYIPTLGKKPLHMAKVPLSWDSKSDIKESLETECSQDSEEWLSSNRMVPWALSGCVALPEFVQTNCALANVLTVKEGSDKAQVIRELANALEDRLLK